MFESPVGLDAGVRAAYLERLGLEAQPPSVSALRSVVRRHVERVPYETWWIAADERWSVDPVAAAERIALRSRGGYCYHLNGALGLLLASLGYAVHGHVGGVQGGGEPDPDAWGNHLVLTVSGLPTEANPAGQWYVDAGLGDALWEPLPLVAGAFTQHPFSLTLERADEEGEGAESWTLTHDPGGGFRSMTWTMAPALESDFVARHEWLSTSPDSGFVRVPMAERRDATGVDVIRGLVLARIGDGAFTDEPIARESAWFEVLAERFDLRFAGSTAQWRHGLWEAVVARHREWEAATGVRA